MSVNKGYVLDMTKGNILSVMLKFAVPVMLGSLFQNIYNLADMTIAGYTMGDNALAAIAATNALTMLMNAVAMGFNSGNSILISNSFGAGDLKRTRKSIAAVIELCVCAMLSITLLLLILIGQLLQLVKTPELVLHDSRVYITIIIAGLSASMTYNMLAGVFRAVGNSKTPLVFLMISSLINIVLDFLFIAVFSWGVAGAAFATVASQLISAVLSGIYFHVKYPQLRLKAEDFKGNGRLIREMLPMGISVAASNSLFAIGDIAVQSAVNSLGPAAIVGQASGAKIKGFCFIPSHSMMNTCITFTAQNYGAGKLDRIVKGLKVANLFNLIINVFTYAAVFFFGSSLIRLVTNTDNQEIRSNGTMLLKIVICFVFTQTIVMTFRVSIQSMHHKIIPIIGTGIELVTRCFCAFVLAPMLGFMGICFSEPLSWVVSGSVMVICFVVIYRKEKRMQLLEK